MPLIYIYFYIEFCNGSFDHSRGCARVIFQPKVRGSASEMSATGNGT